MDLIAAMIPAFVGFVNAFGGFFSTEQDALRRGAAGAPAAAAAGRAGAGEGRKMKARRFILQKGGAAVFQRAARSAADDKEKCRRRRGKIPVGKNYVNRMARARGCGRETGMEKSGGAGRPSCKTVCIHTQPRTFSAPSDACCPAGQRARRDDNVSGRVLQKDEMSTK